MTVANREVRHNSRKTLARAGIVAAALALTACAGRPDVVDPNAQDNAAAAENEAGLGSVAYEPRNRRKCRNRVRTGTRLGRSSCDDRISSQPVRDLTTNDPALMPIVGGGGPARPPN